MAALKDMAAQVKQGPSWQTPIGFGFARIDYGQQSGTVIKVSVPVISWGGDDEDLAAAAVFLFENGAAQQDEIVAPLNEEMIRKLYDCLVNDNKSNLHAAALKAMLEAGAEQGFDVDGDGQKPRFKFIALWADEQCKSVEAAYLKLLALSNGFAKPRSLNLDGIFGLLPNLAWSGNTPYELSYLRENKAALQMAGTYPVITAVDKIPLFLHHVIPADNTRILDATKVRLGAHIADGTTMMPGASYVNFNAGTLGPAMVEGRISSSATIGPGTDVGGGASILGVLSGGNTTPITIGANCLLGANSVTGIPLGDGCIVDAGIAVLAGSKVSLSRDQAEALNAVNERQLPLENTVLKAKDFSGLNGVHFRLDSTNGTLTALRSTFEIKLNEALH